MTDIKDPYASEAETQALLVPDTRMKAERKLAKMMAERGADEQGAEAYLILRQIAVDLLEEPKHTYTSTQATNCAGCGKHKHTPLRIDKMGGYVCLTCIDKELGSLLGEFGYPLPVQGWKLVPYALSPEMSHIVETEMEGRDFADFWRDLLNAAPQPAQQQEPVALEQYDAGLLNDFGGGNVEWWWDYIRAELGRAYEHYQSQITTPQAQPAQQEPVAFLANGTRFKISYDSRQSGGQIHGIPPELGGRWVAFVAADDDCHLKLTSPQPAQPAPPQIDPEHLLALMQTARLEMDKVLDFFKPGPTEKKQKRSGP